MQPVQQTHTPETKDITTSRHPSLFLPYVQGHCPIYQRNSVSRQKVQRQNHVQITWNTETATNEREYQVTRSEEERDSL